MHFFHLQGVKKTHSSLDWLCDPLPAGGRQWEWFLLYSFGEPPCFYPPGTVPLLLQEKPVPLPLPLPEWSKGSGYTVLTVELIRSSGSGVYHCQVCQAWEPREQPGVLGRALHTGEDGQGGISHPQPSGHQGAFRKAGAK